MKQKVNYRVVGDERERELLGYIRQSRMTPDFPAILDPDYHIDRTAEPKGQLVVGGLKFDFAWVPEGVLLELDGGQWLPGGGRHGGDNDRWKTFVAQAAGWHVIHVSYTMLQRNPARVLELLADVLRAGRLDLEGYGFTIQRIGKDS